MFEWFLFPCGLAPVVKIILLVKEKLSSRWGGSNTWMEKKRNPVFSLRFSTKKRLILMIQKCFLYLLFCGVERRSVLCLPSRKIRQSFRLSSACDLILPIVCNEAHAMLTCRPWLRYQQHWTNVYVWGADQRYVIPGWHTNISRRAAVFAQMSHKLQGAIRWKLVTYWRSFSIV